MPTLTPFSSDLQDSKDGAAFADVKFSALNELLERLRTSEVFNPDYIAPVVEPVAEPVSCAEWGGGEGGSNSIFVHGHQIFAKCTCTKMYENVRNMFFPVWKFPG